MRRDVQKNKNKQKQELKNKKIESQKGIYSSEEAYMNITTINLSRKRTEVEMKLPFNFILRDATEAVKHHITYLCRASDLLILTITDMDIDNDLIGLIKRSMPTVVIVHDKKLKSFARAISKSFGSPKICDFSMLSMVVKNLRCQNTTIATERPFMIPMDASYSEGILTVKGFMKNSLRSNQVMINGLYEGIIEEVVVDGDIISGELLNIKNDETLYEKCYDEEDLKSAEDYVNSAEDDVKSVEDDVNSAEDDVNSVDLESQSNEECIESSTNNEDNTDSLIEKYSKYRGIRDLSSCTFKDQLEDMPEYYKNLVFFKSLKHTLNKVKQRECAIPKNKGLTLKVRVSLPQDITNMLTSLVIFNFFEYEAENTILNYEFTSQSTLPQNICVDNGFRVFRTNCIVTRNLNSNVFKEERELVSGVVSFIAPLLLFRFSAFIIPDDNSDSIRLFNGYSQNRIFFNCAKLKGKPVKICKSYAVVKGMFYNKEQVEYFSDIKVEAGNKIQGFIKKPLGIKGAFKAYFAQTVKYGEAIAMSLYKRLFL